MVSIVVPIYNNEKYLTRCLESIRSQDYKDIEVIMIDDGSKDGSRFIAQKYAIDNRFFLISQKNAGVSVARNEGLKRATGEYVLFVDSDDWIEPDMVSVLVDNIQRTGSDISCCQYDKMVRSDIGMLEKWDKNQALETFLVHQKINGSLVNKLIKRDIIEGLQFESSIRYGEDALFCWKALLRSDSLCITNKVLYHVVMHNDSASGGGSYKPIRKDCIKVWKEIANDAEQEKYELGEIAKAQLGNMAFFSLYEMYYYGYINEDDELIFKEALKENTKEIYNCSFINTKEKISVFGVLWCGCIVKHMIRIRSMRRNK